MLQQNFPWFPYLKKKNQIPCFPCTLATLSCLQSAVFTARKRSLWRLCFYKCLSCPQGEGVVVVVSQHALQVTWPGSSILAGALLMCLRWCGGSIQVTSNAWWDRSHSTPGQAPSHPPPGVGTPPGKTPPLDGQWVGGTHPTGMHYCWLVRVS